MFLGAVNHQVMVIVSLSKYRSLRKLVETAVGIITVPVRKFHGNRATADSDRQVKLRPATGLAFALKLWNF